MVKDFRPSLISVVIPCYNIASSLLLLHDAIHSIIMQTYSDWEIIIIDDGSEDKTHNLIKKLLSTHFNDPERAKCFRLPENQGPSVARNYGIKAARGDIITFLDHDDLYLPSHLETIFRHFTERPDIALILSPCFYQTTFKKKSKVHVLKIHDDLNQMTFDELKEHILLKNFPIPMGSGVSCRRLIFEQAPDRLFDTYLSKRTSEDIEFGYRMLLTNIRPYFIREINLIYRTDLNAKSASRSKKALTDCDWYETHQYILEKTGIPLSNQIHADGSQKKIKFFFQHALSISKLQSLVFQGNLFEALKHVALNPKHAKRLIRFLLLKHSKRFEFLAYGLNYYAFKKIANDFDAEKFINAFINNLRGVSCCKMRGQK